jgi:hypothetical protein
MNTLVVKNKLKSIFEYRVTKVDELFNKSNEQASCFFLFRRDLRLEDNIGLFHALKSILYYLFIF